MAREDIIVGIEIGTTKVCVVVCEVRGDGSMRVLGVGEQPARGVRKGEIVDFETCSRCVNDALVEAEEKSDTRIRSVYVGVTGSHIEGFNLHTTLPLSPGGEEVEELHLEELRMQARETTGDRALLYLMPQNYSLDGQDNVINPLGMLARRIEADFHVICGVRTRIQNTIRCIKEFGLEIQDVIPSSQAAAEVALTQQDRDLGALLIDMGGGTTDYMIYTEGVVRHSGVLAVGGEHFTNDISMGLRLPLNVAEQLKVEEASLDPATSLPGEMITIKGSVSFAGRDVSRELLNQIAALRMQETLGVIQREIDARGLTAYLGAGVVFTGGCSLFNGLPAFVEELFGLPVRIGRAHPANTPNGLGHPSRTTPIGIARIGQIRGEEANDEGAFGAIKTFFSGILGRK